MWDNCIRLSFPSCLGLDKLIIGLRTLLFRYYKRSLFLSFVKHLACLYPQEYKAYMQGNRTLFHRGGSTFDFFFTLEKGRDALERALNSSWFEWSGGLGLIFWRWPNNLQKSAKYGFLIHFLKDLHQTKHRLAFNSFPPDNHHGALMLEKLQRIINVRYLKPDYAH